MSEIIIREVMVNYKETIGQAIVGGGFLPYRVCPRLKDEIQFGPKFQGTEVCLNARFFHPPAGSKLLQLPQIMQERGIRGPKDIREVFALGQVIRESKCMFALYAPEITGREDLILKIHRWPDWKGLGLAPSTIDLDRQKVESLEFIGF